MKRILVALDGSERAPGVLAAAYELAVLTDAKLIVFRAVGIPPDLPHEIFERTDQRIEDVLLRNAREGLVQLVRDIPKERVEQVALTFATAWDGICHAARDHDVDLVVIGSHGYGGLDRVLGTTASKVVDHVDRSVLVVRHR